MGVERKERDRKAEGEVLKMGIRSRKKDTGVYGEERTVKRQTKGKSRNESKRV